MGIQNPRQFAGIVGLVTLASLTSIYVCVQRIHIDWHVESGKLTFEEDRMALLLRVSFNTHHGVDVPTCNCKIRCPSFRYDVDLVERNMTATRGIFLFAATEVPGSSVGEGDKCSLSCDALTVLDYYHMGIPLHKQRHFETTAEVHKDSTDMKGRFAGVDQVEVQKPRSAEKPTAGVGGTLDYAVTLRGSAAETLDRFLSGPDGHATVEVAGDITYRQADVNGVELTLGSNAAVGIVRDDEKMELHFPIKTAVVADLRAASAAALALATDRPVAETAPAHYVLPDAAGSEGSASVRTGLTFVATEPSRPLATLFGPQHNLHLDMGKANERRLSEDGSEIDKTVTYAKFEVDGKPIFEMTDVTYYDDKWTNFTQSAMVDGEEWIVNGALACSSLLNPCEKVLLSYTGGADQIKADFDFEADPLKVDLTVGSSAASEGIVTLHGSAVPFRYGFKVTCNADTNCPLAEELGEFYANFDADFSTQNSVKLFVQIPEMEITGGGSLADDHVGLAFKVGTDVVGNFNVSAPETADITTITAGLKISEDSANELCSTLEERTCTDQLSLEVNLLIELPRFIGLPRTVTSNAFN
jgi:hypothetical protein